jgi:hypothetical protein
MSFSTVAVAPLASVTVSRTVTGPSSGKKNVGFRFVDVDWKNSFRPETGASCSHCQETIGSSVSVVRSRKRKTRPSASSETVQSKSAVGGASRPPQVGSTGSAGSSPS